MRSAEQPTTPRTAERTRETKAEKCLAAARGELAELDGYAAEEEMPPPSSAAKKTADILLRQLARKLPRDYAVSLWEDGDVIVFSSGGRGWRVSVYCRANGGASFYVSRPDGHERESHYQSAGDLPVAGVIGAIREMPK